MAATIFWYDNSGNSKGILSYDDAVHEEDLDGSDMLTVTTRQLPYKRDRLLWQDSAGVWREQMVDETVREHKNARPRTVAKCSNSISELYGVLAEGTKDKTTVQAHLNTLLGGTRWTSGTCDVEGTYELEYWHKNVRECIAELCELCGGELVTSIAVDAYGVSSRTAQIVRQRGSTNVTRQFAYGRNVSGIKREVCADEVYTAVIGYGAKVTESDDDEYVSRLTVTATSTTSLDQYGVPRSDGLFTHNFDIYTDTECTSAQFLMRQCRKILRTECQPLVRYEFEVPEVDGDALWRDVSLGDMVHCIDDEFAPTIQLMERVSHISRRLSGRVSCKIAIGARSNPLVKQFKRQKKTDKYVPTATSPTTGGSYGNDTTPIDPSNYDGYLPTENNPDTAGAATYLPHAIDITTEPTKLEYIDGDTIDFSGIEVTLLKEDGSTYTSDAYPNGTVPFGELLFPTSEAFADDGTTAAGAILGQPLYVTRETSDTISYSTDSFCHINMSGQWGNIGYSVSQSGATIEYVGSWKYDFYYDGTQYFDGLVQWWTKGACIVTIEKDVASGDITGKFWEAIESGDDYVIHNGATLVDSTLAKAIISGDGVAVVSIPVQWQRSDGTVLEDTFAITIARASKEEDEGYVPNYDGSGGDASAGDGGWNQDGGGGGSY